MLNAILDYLAVNREGWIRSWLFRLIQIHSARHAIDIALVDPDNKRRIILCFRKDQPAQNRWWFFGGVIRLKEIQKPGTLLQEIALEPTVRRIAEREFGCEIVILGVSKQYVTTFDDGPFGFPVTYTHCLFIVSAIEGSTIKLDLTSSSARSFSVAELSEAGESIHPCLKYVLDIARKELASAGLL